VGPVHRYQNVDYWFFYDCANLGRIRNRCCGKGCTLSQDSAGSRDDAFIHIESVPALCLDARDYFA
jgi:hypothetical protein